MGDYLIRRDSFWWFCRRVPPQYKSVDKRQSVKLTTGIRIADDPKAIRAKQKAHELNVALERYWRDLIGADSAQAVIDYNAAVKAAKVMGISAPMDDATERTIAELLVRIEKLEGKRIEDRPSVLAVYDAAPKPDVTFKQCAERYIEAHRSGWKNVKHAAQWQSTLETYAYPIIGNVPVNKIGGNGDGTDLILKIIQPIWHDKTVTANRVRSRIELVLDFAKAHGYRDGENPARWRGHLDKLLPARGKISPTKHHKALPFAEVPAFIKRLRAMPGISARALEFTILTATRTTEVREAKRSEIDLDSRMWTIPASRMKGGKQHRVPLCDSAIAIIEAMPDGDYIFPSTKKGKPLSPMAMLQTLDRMGVRDQVVTHGFRSTFRDWGSETGDYPHELLEMAIAHTINSKVEAAYRRGDMLAKRHKLMSDWESYCNGEA